MAYLQPDSLEDALRDLAVPGARAVAGGTDFYPALGDGLPSHDIVDLTRVDGLRGISACDLGWNIGAATTWSDLLRADLPPLFDGLKAAAREVGSIQIQNSATIVGNLCNASPAADGVPPLLTLDADVAILGPRRTRRLPLSAFIHGPRQTALNPGEFVTAIAVHKSKGRPASSFLKLGSRKYLVISIAMVAVVLGVEDGKLQDPRISVGACSAVARRLHGLERALEGQPVSVLKRQGLIKPSHLRDLTPLSDVRGSSAYRLDAVRVLCQRALLDAAEKAGA